LAKKLRLAVAGLTDVGRRRDRNQDNVTHLVPTEDKVLQEKGALFVVCDGMGGHAAGEVAAELGVNSLREEYYASGDKDIVTGIANAIKKTNEAIYSYAHDHAGMTGMGTTCVALIVHGGRAFFLNIGDSRAYLIRHGAMRQVTMDHSWVAEQVRAGLLNEEQARNHAHRNVITRSLGTQPTVSADLFIETLHDGDRILLCSDGLHGYVEEQAIEREMLEHSEPARGAQSLIDMANANGGPDNITALIVHLMEVPEVTGELVLPTAPIEDEQIVTRPLPAVAAPVAPPPLVAPRPVAAAATPAPAKNAAKRRRGGGARVAALAIRLLAVAAILIVGLGAWDVVLGPFSQMRAAAARLQVDVNSAKSAVNNASSQDPAAALASLAVARQKLVTDLRDPQLDTQSKQSAQAVLDNEVVPAVRSAAQSYAAAAAIQPVPLGSTVEFGVSCTAPSSTSPLTLDAVSAFAALAVPAAAATPGGAVPPQLLYAVNNGTLYQLAIPLTSDRAPKSDAVTCAALPSAANIATVVALAAEGNTVYALTEQTGGTYQVLSITPAGGAATGTPKVTTHLRVSVATPHGETPTTLAVHGGTTYVGYRGGPTSAGGLWIYTGTTPTAAPQTVTLIQPAMSLTASGATVYALLEDGTAGQLDTAHSFISLPVQVQTPIPPGVTSGYTSATPVPTVTAPVGTSTATDGTVFAHGAVIVADPSVQTDLLVADGANNRVVRFSAADTSGGLRLASQYVYGPPLANLALLAPASTGTTLTIYAWSGARLEAFSVPEPPPGA